MDCEGHGAPQRAGRMRLAVLIDGENAYPHCARAVFEATEALGEARVRGRNAADIAVAVDAMDLMFRHGLERNCADVERQRRHPARPATPRGWCCGLRLRREQGAAGVPRRLPLLRDAGKGPETDANRESGPSREPDRWVMTTGTRRLTASAERRRRAMPARPGASGSRNPSGKRSRTRRRPTKCRPPSSSARRSWRSRAGRRTRIRFRSTASMVPLIERMFRYTWFLATERRDAMLREGRGEELDRLVLEARSLQESLSRDTSD